MIISSMVPKEFVLFQELNEVTSETRQVLQLEVNGRIIELYFLPNQGISLK